MIIPDNLSLDELIGAMKAEEATLLAQNDVASIHAGNLTSFINLAQAVKRELDSKYSLAAAVDKLQGMLRIEDSDFNQAWNTALYAAIDELTGNKAD